MNSATLQPAGPCDLHLLAELSRLSFATEAEQSSGAAPWTARSLAEVLALPGVFGLLALAAEQPVGFALARVVLDEAELLTLGVVPGARRAGHGRRLLAAILAEVQDRGAARITLEVAEYNQSAQALYAAAGFRPAGRRRNYYRNAAGAASDAVVLALSLAPPPGRSARS